MDQAGLELKDLSPFQVVGLKLCDTTARLTKIFLHQHLCILLLDHLLALMMKPSYMSVSSPLLLCKHSDMSPDRITSI